MDERNWDRKLKVMTCGVTENTCDAHHNRCEPTPYAVLQRLADSGYVPGSSRWMDLGCGKGRVGFFLNHALDCAVLGVEYDRRIYAQAEENRRSYGGEKVRFVCADAREYPAYDADHFYFFNPFSVEILRSVLARILESYYGAPRKLRLYFYYPQDSYLTELNTSEFVYVDQIDCRDLFDGNREKETILIYEIG